MGERKPKLKEVVVALKQATDELADYSAPMSVATVLIKLGSAHVTYGSVEQGLQVLTHARGIVFEQGLHDKLPILTGNIVMSLIALGRLDAACEQVQPWLSDQHTKPFDGYPLFTNAIATELLQQAGLDVVLARDGRDAVEARRALCDDGEHIAFDTDHARAAAILTALPPTGGIDVALALSYVDGDAAFYLTLLARFRDGQRNASDELARLLGQGLRDDAIRRAHTLCGVAANIGARDLSAAARALEHVLAAHERVDPPQLTELSAKIAQLLQASLDALEIGFAAGTKCAGAAIPQASQAQAVLSHLLALLEDHSGEALSYIDSAKEALAALLDASTHARLCGHVERIEFEPALLILRAHDVAPIPAKFA